jgi:hypothetical protein
VAGLFGQLIKIEQLGAAIPFSEGMNGVDIAHDFAGCHGERRRTQTVQEIRGCKPPMDITHAGFDEPAKLKLMATLGDFHGSQRAGPFIEILKQVHMDSLEMREVEVAGRDTFGYPLRHHRTLYNIELR